MGFLELQQEPGVYSRVTEEMAIRNSTLGAGGKLAEIFNQSRKSALILGRYGVHGAFLEMQF